MTLTMYDSVTPAYLPLGGDGYAAYVDGLYDNVVAVQARFPHVPVLSIAVHPQHDADCLDVERGDAIPADALGWVRRQLARGAHRPVVYSSQSEMPTVLALLRLGGITRPQIRLWTAHYTHEHICSPMVCAAQGFVADATQWAGSPGNSPGHYDISVLADDFFAAPKPPAPVEDDMACPATILRAESDPTGARHPTLVHDGQFLYSVDGPTLASWRAAGAPTVVVKDTIYAQYLKAAR